MTREEFITVTGFFFERLIQAVKEIPDEKFLEPFAQESVTPRDLFADLSARAEKLVHALELLYQGEEIDNIHEPRKSNLDVKRALAHFRIAHSTVVAALERMPDSRFAETGELPDWMLQNYFTPLEQATTKIEAWAKDLRHRGQAGSTGLPVIQ